MTIDISQLHRTFISGCKSAVMLEASDPEEWSEKEWDRWRMHIKAEAAAGSAAFARMVEKHQQCTTQPRSAPKPTRTKPMFPGQKAVVKRRAQKMVEAHKRAEALRKLDAAQPAVKAQRRKEASERMELRQRRAKQEAKDRRLLDLRDHLSTEANGWGAKTV